MEAKKAPQSEAAIKAQYEMEQVVSEMKKIEAEYIKVTQAKQNLVEKKSENNLVLQEFNLLDSDSKVYKLVGPILAK